MKILIHGSTGRMGRILCDMLTAGYPGLELEAQVSPEAVAILQTESTPICGT